MGRKDRPVLRAPQRRRRLPRATASIASIALAVALAVALAAILSPHPPASSGAFLDQVPIDIGGNNVTGEPGEDHSIVIGCPTGTPTDLFRDVRYLLLRRYAELHATVRANSPDESFVQVRLYRDNQVPAESTVAVGRSAGLDLDLTGVGRLLIRVTCQSPAAAAIFAHARLRYA